MHASLPNMADSDSDDLSNVWVPNRRRSDQAPSPTEEPPRALAVDDDDSYLRLISAILQEVGFEVTLATNGLDALQELQRREFELVLLDLQMPGLDGFETLEGTPGHRERFYAVLLTANDSLEVRLEAFNRGFNDFISKKANYLEIMAKLKSARRTVLLQRRLRDEVNELKQLAMTDQLTGLANRFYLLARAREMSALDRPMHLALFDLDSFKSVNDRFGHVMGDRILADVGMTFRRGTRQNDTVARFGGDEFVMLLSGIDEEAADAIAQRVTDDIAKLRWNMAGVELRISCSYGIATGSGRDKTLPGLVTEADRNLMRRKRELHGKPVESPC
jgi:two-component system cell cycle response regulator